MLIAPVHASGLSQTKAGIYPAPTLPSRGHDSPPISPSHPIKNTGHLTQCSLILRIVRVETLTQCMEALRANCGVHASGLSRTEAGLQPAPTPPSRGHDSSSISPSHPIKNTGTSIIVFSRLPNREVLQKNFHSRHNSPLPSQGRGVTHPSVITRIFGAGLEYFIFLNNLTKSRLQNYGTATD